MGRTDKRNEYGIKDSINCYLTIKGVQYEQWQDVMDVKAYDKTGAKRALQTMKIERPGDRFIIRLINKEFYRIYRAITKGYENEIG